MSALGAELERLTHVHTMHFRWVNDVRPQWFCICGAVCDSPQEAIEALSRRRAFTWRKSVLTAVMSLIFVML
jgi:hypothetical protein